MNPIIMTQISELKGYIDACVDAYEEASGGIPFSVIETIQRKIETIALGIQEEVDP